MDIEHNHPAVKIIRTGKIIIPTGRGTWPNFQRKDEWQRYYCGTAIPLPIGPCGCFWVHAVSAIINEIHPHLSKKIESYMDWSNTYLGFSIKMTKAEFMTSAGIYVDCGDELKLYPDDELLILLSGHLMEKAAEVK